MTSATDPEIAALTVMVAAMDALDADTRQRIVRWIVARYNPQPATVAIERRRRPGDWNLDQVAEIYNNAEVNPAKTLREQLGVTTATASRLIKVARDQGLLKPPPHRAAAS
jgi:hypothetical protein